MNGNVCKSQLVLQMSDQKTDSQIVNLKRNCVFLIRKRLKAKECLIWFTEKNLKNIYQEKNNQKEADINIILNKC